MIIFRDIGLVEYVAFWSEKHTDSEDNNNTKFEMLKNEKSNGLHIVIKIKQQRQNCQKNTRSTF